MSNDAAQSGRAYFNQLVAQARDGGKQHLWDLHRSLKPELCNSAVIKAILKHLRLELVPNLAINEHKREPHATHAQNALPSVTMLSVVARALQSNPSLRDAAVTLLDPAVEGICMWINFCLHFGLSIPMDETPGCDFRQSYFIQSQLLLDLLNSHPRILNMFLSSPTFSDLLIRIWMTEGKRSEVFMRLQGSAPCPIMTLLLKTLKEDIGRETFLTRIFIRPKEFPGDFAGRFVLRAHQLIEYATPAQAIAYIEALITAIDLMFSSHTHLLRRSFVEAQYLTQFASILDEVSHDILDEEDNPEDLLSALFRPTCKLMKLIMYETPRAVRNHRDLWAGNYLPLLVRVVPSLPRDDDGLVGAALHLFQVLGEYTVYPCVVQAALDEPPAEQAAKDLLRLPKVAPVWKEFKGTLDERVKALGGMPKDVTVTICDNPSCGSSKVTTTTVTTGGDRKHMEPKQCSRCSSVVYCSETCQKEDWKQRHQMECRRAKVYHSRRRSENAWYSHTSRAFHAHLVADTYNAHLAEIEAEIAETYRDTPLTHVVPALMFTGIKYGVQFELITPSRPSSLSAGKRAGLEWWNRGSKVAFKQRWLKPRVSDLIEVYRDSEDGGKQTRVVEGVFHLGEEYAVFLSVRLRKSESGRWEPGYCIARYGTQAGEPA